jgi:hypothetical protein
MSSALDTFERSLVAASRTLVAAGNPATLVAPLPHPRQTWWRRLRSRGLVAQLAVLAAALSVFAGAAVAGYALFNGGPARQLAAFECQIDGNFSAMVDAVTGNPIRDCAGAWAQATGGRSTAPRLAIWGADNGQRLVAVVAPASAGRPSGDDHFHWKRLRDSWTVNLPLVVLNDQLSNINLPFNGGADSPCSFTASDVTAVRSLLRTDRLKGWRVTLRAQAGKLSRGCRSVFTDVFGASRTVQLIQAVPTRPPSKSSAQSGSSSLTETRTTPARGPKLSAYQLALTHAAIAAYKRETRLYTNVNAQLSAHCASVPNAVRLWRRAATAARFSPTTLGFWHTVNARQHPDPATFFGHYTLYVQPAGQHTGSCAHVLVMDVGGSGIPNVYVARIAP